MAVPIPRFLYPNRYLLVLFGFFVLFPVFMDVITPEVIYGYAGGTVDAQGNVVSSYEGGTAPQYQWYYPFLYPFILFWYLAIMGFGVFDFIVPDGFITFHVAELVYYYLLAAVIALLVRTAVSRVGPFLGRLVPNRKSRGS